MAFSDPQSLTINSVATSLPRTGFGVDKGTFTAADGTVTLAISHTRGKRVRHSVRVDHSKVAADPFVANVSAKVGMSAYLVIDMPINGYSATEAKQIVDALTAYLTASSGGNVTRVLGGEI
jgi:hypothetical protein